MNLAEIWETPGYFYALGYSLSVAIVLRFEGRRGVARGLIACGLLLAFLAPFSIATKGAWGLAFVASMVVMVGAILGCVYYILHDVQRTLFAGIKAFIYGEFASSLCWQVYYAAAVRWPVFRSWQARDIVMLVAFGVIMSVEYGLERSLHRQDATLRLSSRDLAVEALIALSVYVVSNLGYIDSSSLFSGSYARDVFAIRTLVDLSGVTMLYALHRQLIELQARFEKDTLHNIMQMQYQAYQLSQESIDMVNRKYHDLKHQIALLRSQALGDKAGEYLSDMERDIKKYEAQHRTGNPVLDAVLTNKSLYCQNHDIELKYIADGGALGMLSDMEIAALFGNMLDNAIESVERLPDTTKRMIRLYVAGDRGFLRVRIENWCEDKLRFEDGMPVTTKRDKRFHGFGMKSMRRTVEQHGGSMVASQRENWFELKILIPLTKG